MTSNAQPLQLESRNDEQTATDRNQVLDQSDVEIWLAQGPYGAERGPVITKKTFV